MNIRAFYILAFLIFSMAAPSHAQQAPAPAAVAKAGLTEPLKESLLFSDGEIVSIRNALMQKGGGIPNAEGVVIPQRRVISLAGVFFRTPSDWIVWLNGKKMTPGDVLPEVVDIQVEKDTVALKWFDIGMNDVISISLRPHQTYDIVTGVLLPGAG